MSTVPFAANDKSAWIRDLVYLAFPEGEARERAVSYTHLGRHSGRQCALVVLAV